MSTLPTWLDGPVVSVIRRILAFAFVVGSLGTLTELLLLEHFDDPWQYVPLVLLAVGLLEFAWYATSRNATALRVFQWTMALFAVAGAVGVLMHLNGNRVFELEGDPNMGGWALFKATIMGATPALAPGAMVQLALVGLAYTFRHPVLTGSPDSSST
jgi:hypothetical protein